VEPPKDSAELAEPAEANHVLPTFRLGAVDQEAPFHFLFVLTTAAALLLVEPPKEIALFGVPFAAAYARASSKVALRFTQAVPFQDSIELRKMLEPV
jgi:hypothetical protein